MTSYFVAIGGEGQTSSPMAEEYVRRVPRGSTRSDRSPQRPCYARVEALIIHTVPAVDPDTRLLQPAVDFA